MYAADRFTGYAVEQVSREVKPVRMKEAWVVRATDEESWGAKNFVESELDKYEVQLRSREAALSDVETQHLLSEFARTKCEEALRDEGSAARRAASFVRTAPLAPNKDVEPIDGLAMSAAFQREAETRALRQAWCDKYHELRRASE